MQDIDLNVQVQLECEFINEINFMGICMLNKSACIFIYNIYTFTCLLTIIFETEEIICFSIIAKSNKVNSSNIVN